MNETLYVNERNVWRYSTRLLTNFELMVHDADTIKSHTVEIATAVPDALDRHEIPWVTLDYVHPGVLTVTGNGDPNNRELTRRVAAAVAEGVTNGTRLRH